MLVLDMTTRKNGNESLRAITILSFIVLIILIITVSNLTWIFKDGLIKDDGAWYYAASEGKAIWDSSHHRAMISKLVPYRDTLYSYGMTTIGLYYTRLIFVVVMSFCSVCAFVIYRNLLGIRTVPAVVAALIPNLLPLVTEVPTGLNSSYAIWGLLPVLISLIFYWISTSKLGYGSYFWLGLSCLFFLFGMNQSTSTVFLAPGMLVLALLFFKRRPQITILYCALVIGYSAYHVYLMSKYSHVTPTHVPIELVLKRIEQFFAASNILPFASGKSSIAVFSFGIFALTIRPFAASLLVSKQVTSRWQHLWIAAWILTWVGSTSIAYIALAHQFEVSRHSYVYNYGSVLAQIIGLFTIIYSFSRIRLVPERVMHFLVLSIAVFLIGYSGWERYCAGRDTYAQYDRDSALVRSTLATIDLRENTQVLILDVLPVHEGSVLYNSGYIRYLTGRNDLKSVMGKDDLYPHDPFAKGGGAWGFMRGLSLEYPLVAFRRKGNQLDKVDYLLRVTAEAKESASEFLWELYDTTGSTRIPAPEFRGHSLGEYYQVINSIEANTGRNIDVAFAPGLYPEKLLIEQEDKEGVGAQNLIAQSINFGPGLNLHSVRVLTRRNEYRLQMVLSVSGDLKKNNFLLCYFINGKFHVINIAKFAAEGQFIEVTSIPISDNAFSKGIRLGFANRYHKLPLIPLNIVSKEHEGENHIFIKK